MALRLEKSSDTVWAVYSDATLLFEIRGTTVSLGTGATLKAGGAAVGLTGTALANVVGSPTNGLRIATGVLTTASAADTVVTGLTTITACFATYSTDPADANTFVSATKGDQAGSPAAGSIIVKTWKTDGTDPTPTAADAFSKLVNLLAIGTKV